MPLFLLPLLLQITPTPPLPKGTGKPPEPQGEAAAVMVPVNATFAAIAARNGELLRPLAREDGNLFIANEAADGTRKIIRRPMTEFFAGLKPGPEKYEERLYDPAIEVDGDLAFVWGRFNFYIDGKLHHCGYDLFDLVRENGTWKVANISYSSRTTGCSE
ncbi:MAG: nuclear transport factor 2 family protein [Sphingomonas sp.]|uniref:nuclear transport factor 2 family protein n=1 Tax=Sphingomonas sp. TaxID=28214 RepID=UPI0025D93BA1|nr:nuclear transport factor 2 family protein [Sphingomonas sp.]MBY0284392.1 nuclear transport factor 2 family protein [Sphingomonas sp.]